MYSAQMDCVTYGYRIYTVVLTVARSLCSAHKLPMYCFVCRAEMRECIFNKGQSKRIWNELFKV